jgi:hypothetical protein
MYRLRMFLDGIMPLVLTAMNMLAAALQTASWRAAAWMS